MNWTEENGWSRAYWNGDSWEIFESTNQHKCFIRKNGETVEVRKTISEAKQWVEENK